MHLQASIAAVALFLAPLTAAVGLYPKGSSVLNIDSKDFKKSIKDSDKASVSSRIV